MKTINQLLTTNTETSYPIAERHSQPHRMVAMSVSSWANLNSILQTEDRYKDADPELSIALGKLFAEWEEHFTNKLKDAKTLFNKNVVLSWAVSLQRLGMTPCEFLIARDKAVEISWFPTSAADFFELAQKQIMSNYPDMRIAYMRAANNNFDIMIDNDENSIIYETAKRVDFWLLKSQSERYSWKRWQEVYPTVCREHFLGKRFMLPKAQAIAPSPPAPPEVSSAYLNKIKSLLNERKGTDGNDMYSEQASDKDFQATTTAPVPTQVLPLRELIKQQYIPVL